MVRWRSPGSWNTEASTPLALPSSFSRQSALNPASASLMDAALSGSERKCVNSLLPLAPSTMSRRRDQAERTEAGEGPETTTSPSAPCLGITMRVLVSPSILFLVAPFLPMMSAKKALATWKLIWKRSASS